MNSALDAVISLIGGAPTSFNHLATSVRFSTAGVLDVRDGATYRADASMPFALRAAVQAPHRRRRPVAHVLGLRRPELRHDAPRGGATRSAPPPRPCRASIGFAAIVDGAAGQLSICNLVTTAPTKVAYSREGAFGVVPLASDIVLVSDGSAITMRLSATGAVLNQLAAGGELAADQLGRAYLARVTGTQLSLGAYTESLAPVWSRLDPVASGTRVLGVAADAAGVTVALAPTSGPVSIVRYPRVRRRRRHALHRRHAAAVAGDGFAVATAAPGVYDVTAFDTTGAPLWPQSFPGAVGSSIEVMTLGLGGRVAIGGHFYADVTFGGPTLVLAQNGPPNVNSYLVGLDRATGAHVFTNRVSASRLTGVAGNGPRLVITGERWVTPIFPDLWQYDATGAAGRVPARHRLLRAMGPQRPHRDQRHEPRLLGRSMVWPQPTSPAFRTCSRCARSTVSVGRASRPGRAARGACLTALDGARTIGPMDRSYVEWVRVESYRCIRSADLHLTPLHALIGPNDSGKSSLLRAIEQEFAKSPGHGHRCGYRTASRSIRNAGMTRCHELSAHPAGRRPASRDDQRSQVRHSVRS